MLSLRILLRTILLMASIQLSWGAAVASAQHSFGVYTDVDGNESTLFAYISTQDLSSDTWCDHIGYETYGRLLGPTGLDEGSAPWFNLQLSVPLGEGDFGLYGQLSVSCGCAGYVSGGNEEQVKVRNYASRWAFYNGFDPNAQEHQYIPRSGVQECFHKCAQPNVGLVLSPVPPISGQENFSALQRFGTNVEKGGTGACIGFKGRDSVYDYRTTTGACHITP